VDSGLLAQQISALWEDIEAAGIKLGLLGGAKNMEVIAASLASRDGLPIVVDPVFRSSSGMDFVTERDLAFFRKRILPLASVLTPNAEEAGRLLGIGVSTLEEMKGAAKLLHEQGVPHVVITGGHLEKADDVYYEGQEIEIFSSQHMESTSTHGTGCTFSSAILANMVNGKAVRESVVMAKAYLSQAIARAYPIGGGRGPLNHLFRFGDAPVRAASPEVLHEEPHR